MECRMISQFLIAAPSSGSGKTTVSRGLMALLIKKGLKVQPFKCGPDYIDTKYHTAVCRRPSINLDTFMASAGQNPMDGKSHEAGATIRVVSSDGFHQANVGQIVGIVRPDTAQSGQQTQ